MPLRSGAGVGALYDSVSPNTGDRAIGIAVGQELARHGVGPTQVLSPFEEVDTHGRLVVVGGGDLIRPVGDNFYDRFRPSGPAVLNSVGVWDDADRLEYLRDYELVSARTSREVDVLRSAVPDAQLLPCTTTTLESPDIRIDGLPEDEPVVGIHVVPHTLRLVPELVEIVDAIDRPKVFIPFTHYNYDDSFMESLPFDRSRAVVLPRLEPLELHAVMRQMSYVIVSTLHGTIFSYSQNVPFITVDQRKVRNYLDDRGLSDRIFHDGPSLKDLVRQTEAEPPDFSAQISADKDAVHEAFTRIAAMVGQPAGDAGGGVPRPDGDGADVPPLLPAAEDPLTVTTFLMEQQGAVVRDRDVALADAHRRAGDLTAQVRALAAEQRVLSAELAARAEYASRLRTDLDTALALLEGTVDRRLRATARKVVDRIRSILVRQ
ncbi:polysaccharide pyruvyl transferase family protein [Georgenia sp. SUBG003]|uniref:polysaccharide pyruvyl transferase family protein n=1 Tax=Georgenia sp. SUBG003 TaxID=1497974 RepID=UPI0004D39F78|nr:hypothetical protein DA06_01375 [Georgenia sp. SUBG003]